MHINIWNVFEKHTAANLQMNMYICLKNSFSRERLEALICTQEAVAPANDCSLILQAIKIDNNV